MCEETLYKANVDCVHSVVEPKCLQHCYQQASDTFPSYLFSVKCCDFCFTGDHRESVELLTNSVVCYAVSDKTRAALCNELTSRSLLTLVKWLQVGTLHCSVRVISVYFVQPGSVFVYTVEL